MDRGFLTESLRSAIESIKTNKLRSLLTTLGIIIGVTTVIAVVSAISGLKQQVAKSFSSLGANVLYVQKFPWVVGGKNIEWWNIKKRRDIGLKEVQALKEYGSSFEYVAPQVSRAFDVEMGEKKARNVTIQGTSEDFPVIMNQGVNLGRFLNHDDIKYRRDHCVLGKDVSNTLFPDENPIGKAVRIKGRLFTVVGLLEEKGEIMGQSLDNVAVIPYTTIMSKFTGGRESITIALLAEDEEEARQEIRWILRRVRDVKPEEEDDFSINSSGALAKEFNQLTRTMFIIMVGIAAISLVVGGIGIMNIMLVSVTERTREIGIRKAIGAKSKEILIQFLLESIMICFLGGFIGIFLGFSLTKLLSIVGNIPFAMPFWSVLLGFGFSVAIGIFFGFYPARKASSLNPVEALRYE